MTLSFYAVISAIALLPIALIQEQNGFAKRTQFASDSSVVNLSPGTTLDAAKQLRAFFGDPRPITIRLSQGVFAIPCGAAFDAKSDVSMIGSGQKTILRLSPGCRLRTDLFKWDARSKVQVRNLTVDLSQSAASDNPHSIFAFYAYSEDAAELSVSNVSIVGGAAPIFLITVAAAGHTYKNVEVVHNDLTLRESSPLQNQCVAFTTNGGAGSIPAARVENNICVRSALQIDGESPQVIGNDISHWRFGTGIFVGFARGRKNAATSRDCLFAGNKLHDAEAGVDINHTATGGLENNCIGSHVNQNAAWNLGGAGFYDFAESVVYDGNTAFAVGKNGSSGAGGSLDTAGFAVSENGSGNPAYSAQHLMFINNRAYDGGSGHMSYGYAEEPYHSFSSVLKCNDYKGRIGRVRIPSGSKSRELPCSSG